MATWRWADLSAVAKPPAPVAAGDPFAYGVPVCDEGGPFDFDTGGCPILVARVVFRGVDNTIGSSFGDVYELNLDGQWYCNDLCAGNALKGASPGTYDDPTAYVGVRNGTAVAIVNYIATSSVCQLFLPEGGGWGWADISGVMIPTPWPAEGRAFGYWDSYNSVERVVYRGTPPNDHEIYELSTKQNSWVFGNLSTNDKSEPPAPPAAGDPFGYCYGGVPRVIYLGTDNHIHELHPEPFWKHQDLSVASGGSPKAASAPYAYVAGVARVIYTDIDGQIIEMALESSGWKWNNLSTNDKSEKPAPPAAGDPFGYVTFDGSRRVIYRGTDGHIYELHSDQSTNFFWRWNDLSSIAKATSPAQVAAGDPFGYEIGDSIPRVVYRGTNGHICELALY